jgi:amino-acid N-acetyltransferase
MRSELRDVSIGPARAALLADALDLLAEAELPLEGVAERFSEFLVAQAGGRLVGVVGLEVYGASALLRSLAVRADQRGRGLGQALTRAALRQAQARGVRRIYLLTETAAPFFERFGFGVIRREAADPAVQESVEFRSACPQSATCMALQLSTIRT